uniref:F-box and FNIP repeat-containing protein n=1 Tax=viral metagenome TaxID=1070528 RepID=A0A6C0C7R6_9ZZZZ
MNIYSDIFLEIAKFLTNIEKIRLSMTSTEMDKLKRLFIYQDKVCIMKILNLPYYDNFEFVDIGYDYQGSKKCPKCVKYVNCVANGRIPEITMPINMITHLTCNSVFQGSLENYIPRSVIHLSINDHFDQSIKDCIPSSVTHLTFGGKINQIMRKCIPLSVTHLIFGDRFNEPIENCIPSSVTHLTFAIILIKE